MLDEEDVEYKAYDNGVGDDYFEEHDAGDLFNLQTGHSHRVQARIWKKKAKYVCTENRVGVDSYTTYSTLQVEMASL